MLPPLARIAAAALWAAATLIARHDLSAAIVYAGAFSYIIASHSGREHLRFVLFAGLPLLAALLFTWALVMPFAHATGATDIRAGIHQALLFWLRILTLAATCQWLLLPLVSEPLRLRAFVASLGMPASAGILLAMPVLILPEIQRQIRQVTDARRAQRLPSWGLRGALALPATIVPVLAALIETALNRAELWEHRGLLAGRAVAPIQRWTPWSTAWLAFVLPAGLLAWEVTA